MLDVEKGFSCDRDYMRLAHFDLLGFLELKGKLCVVQPKTVCRRSHHMEPTGISTPTLPAFSTFGIFEHESNVAISFDFYANEAASEVIPFLFSCDSNPFRASKAHLIPALSNRKSAMA